MKKWINELQRCKANGDIVGAVRALDKITRLVVIEAVVGLVVAIAITGICTYDAAKIRREYAEAKALTLPADEDIVGNTVIRVEVDGEEHLMICDYAKVFVSVYDEFDVAHDEQYEWVNTEDDYLVVMGVYSARLDNNLFITVAKYYEDQNKPRSYTVGKEVIVDYRYTLSYPFDSEEENNAPIITIQ